MTPTVLVTACNRMLGQHPFHVAGHKYVEAVRLAGALPVVAPSGAPHEIDALLDMADGVLLTGSQSNLDPSFYGETVADASLPVDPARDAWVLALIPKALARGIPLFGICRGFQETNVALGGSLHQQVQAVEGHHDHRARADASASEAYGPAHPVTLRPEGRMAGILDGLPGLPTILVNSVHGQGVRGLAEGLRIEAVAPDGLVEAFSVAGAPGWSLCVQWHPEWQAASNPVSVRLFAAFGDACRQYRSRRPKVPEPDR